MKEFTEAQLEEIENSLIDVIDENLNYMTKSNRVDLCSMLLESLESRVNEATDEG